MRTLEQSAKLFAVIVLTALPGGCILLPFGPDAFLLSMLMTMALSLLGLALAAPALVLLKLTRRLTRAPLFCVAVCAGTLTGMTLGYANLESDLPAGAPAVFNPNLAVLGASIGAAFGVRSAFLWLLLFRVTKPS
jgi:hypothetical protein